MPRPADSSLPGGVQQAERPAASQWDAFAELLTPALGIPQPQPRPGTRREALARETLQHGRKRRRGFRPWRVMVALFVVVLLGGVATVGTVVATHPAQVKALFGGSNDYTGPGTGSTRVTVKPGDVGSDVARTLASAGVTKTSDAFYHLLISTRPEPTLQAGTYRLAKHQSAATALAALQDPKNRVIASVTLPEGSTARQILAATAKATGTPLADLQAAAADYRSLGVPASAPSVEGYLFPATYQFEPGTSAKAMLTRMVQRAFQALDEAGVAPKDRQHVLTLAGLVQKEGNGPDDAKVARVFLNRIRTGMLLQSDATVSYGAGGTTVVPTTKQYASKNPYNTYVHPGLPVGPISNPGDQAIRAALHPAPGPWLFFVTVNLQTGETVFSTTDAEHEKASARFSAWLKAHPSYGK